MKRFYKEAALPALALAIASCSSVSDTAAGKPAADNVTDAKLASLNGTSPEIADKTDFSLEILHVNDVHSYIDPNKVSLKTGSGLVRVKVGGPEAIRSVIEERRRDNPNVVVISAGDQITGNASNYDNFHGEADAALHGMYGTDYYVYGNHEFDHGGKGLRTFVDFMTRLSPKSVLLNSDMAVGPKNPLKGHNGVTQDFREIDGHTVAFYGVTTGKKIVHSSSPDPDKSFIDTVPLINQMTARNRDKAKIHVLVTHQGVVADRTNAPLLNDVDIIVGGDSHSLCGDFSKYGFKGECTYPLTRENASGHKICVVQANEYGKIIGDLRVSFDKDGNVLKCEGTPYMPLWVDSAELKGVPKSPDNKVTAEAEIKNLINEPGSPFIEARFSQAAYDAMKPYRDAIKAKFTTLGQAPQDTCTTRYPTDECVIKNGPNPYGSETCKVFGKVFLDEVGGEIYLGNSGMFRVDMEEGEFTDGDLLAIIPFSNEMKEVRLTGKEFVSVLNQVIRYINADTAARDGGTPCGWGFTYAMKMSGDNPVTDVMFTDSNGKSAPIDLKKTYRVITTDYVLRGKDGFALLKKKKAGKVLGIDADIVKNYLKKHGSFPELNAEEFKTITSFTE